MIVEIRVTTDAFPKETEWILKDKCGLGIRIPMTASTQQGNFSTPEICLPISEYEFTIMDSTGDGFCCDFGDGWYDIRVNGITVHSSSGTFGFSETKTFGDCVSPPTPTTTQEGENLSHIYLVQLLGVNDATQTPMLSDASHLISFYLSNYPIEYCNRDAIATTDTIPDNES